MHKLTLATLLVVVVMTAACSRPRPEPQIVIPSPTRRLLVLQQRLGLTVGQMDAIKPILEEEQQGKMALMMVMKEGDEEARKAAKHDLEDLDWEIFKKLSAQLSKEQVDELVTFLLEEDQEGEFEAIPPGEMP